MSAFNFTLTGTGLLVDLVDYTVGPCPMCGTPEDSESEYVERMPAKVVKSKAGYPVCPQCYSKAEYTRSQVEQLRREWKREMEEEYENAMHGRGR